jgi:hypothetical protein
MLRNITKRERMLAAATVSIAIVAIVYNFIIDPVIGQWNDLDKKIIDKEGVLKKHSRILRDRSNIEKLRAQHAKYFELKRLTPEEESAIALSLIEKTARETRVQITNIKPIAYKLFRNYNKFTFRVSTESKMSELTKFVYDLQSSDQLLKVERMVLRAKENDPTIIKSMLNITKISVF